MKQWGSQAAELWTIVSWRVRVQFCCYAIERYWFPCAVSADVGNKWTTATDKTNHADEWWWKVPTGFDSGRIEIFRGLDRQADLTCAWFSSVLVTALLFFSVPKQWCSSPVGKSRFCVKDSVWKLQLRWLILASALRGIQGRVLLKLKLNFQPVLPFQSWVLRVNNCQQSQRKSPVLVQRVAKKFLGREARHQWRPSRDFSSVGLPSRRSSGSQRLAIVLSCNHYHS